MAANTPSPDIGGAAGVTDGGGAAPASGGWRRQQRRRHDDRPGTRRRRAASAPRRPASRWASSACPTVGGAPRPGGFDCSGLVMWAFAQVGVSLPHNAAAQYGVGAPVDQANLQPGDLVFFSGLGHVGHLHRRRPVRPRAADRRRREGVVDGPRRLRGRPSRGVAARPRGSHGALRPHRRDVCCDAPRRSPDRGGDPRGARRRTLRRQRRGRHRQLRAAGSRRDRRRAVRRDDRAAAAGRGSGRRGHGGGAAARRCERRCGDGDPHRPALDGLRPGAPGAAARRAATRRGPDVRPYLP